MKISNQHYFRHHLLVLPIAASLAACSLSTDSPAQTELQDCDDCPTMVQLPAGDFMMGTAAEDRLIDPRTGAPVKNDSPQHTVTIATPFAIGKYEVTVAEFGRFIAATGHAPVNQCMGFSEQDVFAVRKDIDWESPGFEQAQNMPVGCISFFDAEAYANWLGSETGYFYRLPTEAEWEYATRAGSTQSYFWGDDPADSCTYANVRSPGADSISARQSQFDTDNGFPCDDNYAQVSPAGNYAPNEFGLYDMQGNNWEWVADCYHKNYEGAPTDGSPWLDAKACRFGLIRGGSYLNRVERSSATVRAGRPRSGAATNMGFRVARSDTKAPTAGTTSAAMTFEARADVSEGALLFADNCAACHESPAGFEGLYGTDQALLEQTIADGGTNVMSMPAFGERLTSEEISTLAAYLRKVNGWN